MTFQTIDRGGIGRHNALPRSALHAAGSRRPSYQGQHPAFRCDQARLATTSDLVFNNYENIRCFRVGLPSTVYDRNAPSVKRVVAELEDPEVRAGLTRLSVQMTGSPADADDLAADALERVIDPDDSPWEKRTFLTHMKFVMRQVWDQQRRAVRF